MESAIREINEIPAIGMIENRKLHQKIMFYTLPSTFIHCINHEYQKRTLLVESAIREINEIPAIGMIENRKLHQKIMF